MVCKIDVRPLLSTTFNSASAHYHPKFASASSKQLAQIATKEILERIFYPPKQNVVESWGEHTWDSSAGAACASRSAANSGKGDQYTDYESRQHYTCSTTTPVSLTPILLF